MEVNEGLKKYVDRQTQKLRKCNEILVGLNDRIRRSIILLYVTIIIGLTLLILNNVEALCMLGDLYVFYMIQIAKIMMLIILIRLKHIEKRYRNEYTNAIEIMAKLTDMTEWSNLRKRYVLNMDKDYPETAVIGDLIRIIGDKVSPVNHSINYYRIFMFGALLLMFIFMMTDLFLFLT